MPSYLGMLYSNISPDLASIFIFAISIVITPTSISTSQVSSSRTAFKGRVKKRCFLMKLLAISVASEADFTSPVIVLSFATSPSARASSPAVQHQPLQ